MSQNVFFEIFIWNFCCAKSHLKVPKIKSDFAQQKFQIKISKNMFCDTYTKRHKTPLCHFSANHFVNNDSSHCKLRSALFYKKYIVNDEIVFRKNGVVGFITHRYLYHRHIFWHFCLKFWARKIALKTSKNARNSAKFEHEKLLIKIRKIMFCDTYTQRPKTPLRNFSGKIFRKWRSTLMVIEY